MSIATTNSEHTPPPKPPAFDREQTVRHLRTLCDPTSGCFEVRYFRSEWKNGLIVKSEYSSTIAAWFNDPVRAADVIASKVYGTSSYVTVNPVNPGFMARDAANRFRKEKTTTADGDVARVCWLYLDFDPVTRPTETSATGEELKAALDRRDLVLDSVPGLRESSVWGCSGNGGWVLVYLGSLPNDDSTRKLVAADVHVFSSRFSDDLVNVDRKVVNPSRVMCLAGTLKCKGRNTPDRPWRMVTIDSPPDRVLEVFDSMPFIQAFEPAPPPAAGKTPAARKPSGEDGRLARRVRAYLAGIAPAVSGNNGHDQTFDAACALVQGFALEPQEAYPYLAEWNASCDPPWPEADLIHKLDDATKVANNGKPRGYLRDVDPPAPVPAAQAAACNAPNTGRGAPSLGMEDNPHRLARVVLDKRRHPDGLKLRFWNEAWYAWEGGRDEEVLPGVLKAEVSRDLEKEARFVFAAQAQENAGRKGEKEKASKMMRITGRLTGDVVLAMSGLALLEGVRSIPAWVEPHEWPVNEVVSARNGLVHLPGFVEGRDYIIPPTPRFFTRSGLDYDFDPEAPTPINWLTFLGTLPVREDSEVRLQLWPDDPESVNLLQEWFGYCLVANTRLQKMLAMIGPTRSGKGTIASVLSALIGEDSVEGPTLNELGRPFGLEKLIGKSVAIIDDARITHMTDVGTIAERLLSISGEGRLTVPRKHISSWTGVLSTRVMLLSNTLPRIADSSGALSGRFLLLSMTQSFLGREDPDLLRKILPELPGILLWAILGWERLWKRGRFLQPASGRLLLDELDDLASPVGAFLRDRCEVGAGLSVPCREIYEAWKVWCNENGKTQPGEVQTFGRDLRSVLPNLGVTRPRVNGVQERRYEGVGLLPPGWRDEAGEWVSF